MNLYKFESEQLLNTDLSKAWEFISSPQNLARITPAKMKHRFTSLLPDKVYLDLLIHHQIKPFLGIALNWTTMITEVKEQESFIDEQVKGPFAYWVHEHRLFETQNGVLMKDVITYKPPFGLIGKFANRLLIVPRLKKLFEYREHVLNKEFS